MDPAKNSKISFDTATITKKTNQREIEMYKLLDGLGVTPQIFAIDENTLTTKKYDTTLLLLVYNKEISPEKARELTVKYVYPLIDILDTHKIIHQDLYARNIVCNKDLNEFRIIDFEEAFLANTLNREKFLRNKFNRAQIDLSLWDISYHHSVCNVLLNIHSDGPYME